MAQPKLTVVSPPDCCAGLPRATRAGAGALLGRPPPQTEIARAVDEAGLLPCEGDASAPEFTIPIKQMNKAFEPGKPFEFSLEVALMSKDTDAADGPSSEGGEVADAPEAESAPEVESAPEAASEPEADVVTDVAPVAAKAEEAS